MSANEPRMWTFLTGNGREREVGPYRMQEEAQESFQRRWGYWPDVAIRVTPFVPKVVHGMCTACGAVEVELKKATGTRDLSGIGESSNYPSGYGCEVCS